MDSGDRSANVKGESRRFGLTFPRIVVMIAALCFHQPVRARGQSTPQIQIDDAAPGASFPTDTIPARRLSELVNKGKWSEAENLAQELAQQEPGDPAVYLSGARRFAPAIGTLATRR